MSKLEIFKHIDFGEVRGMVIDDIPYFVGLDVAKALGYKLPKKAISDHCNSVSVIDTETSKGKRKTRIIPEPDLYRLIFRSKLKSAEKFKDWVFESVLPMLRKTGGYVNDVNKFMDNYLGELDEEQTKLVFKGLTKKVDKLRSKNEEQKKKIINLSDRNRSNIGKTGGYAKSRNYYKEKYNELKDELSNIINESIDDEQNDNK